ncbi:mfs general substrate transporter [Trichoderma arundinaceum]|uniref:Mfs general substrate transporter n=1 Tax=Trichoderma arundinaceum TaxID=490622 RepID=A0A395NCC9_TRIAR|nr:mfs general substrate transporter [Trichoderma arundinaceum]
MPKTSDSGLVQEAEIGKSSPVQEDISPVENQNAVDGHHDDVSYPGTFQICLILVALALSIFLIGLDGTIVGTAIPSITKEFKQLNDVGWYGSAYLVTTCGMQLFYGRLYTLFPVKSCFLSSIFIFEIGSLVCAVAPNSVALIVGRAIAGLGSGGVISGVFIIQSYAVPLRFRPTIGGLLGAMEGVAMAVAPLISGVLAQHVTWRWCFYINLPLGGFSLGVIAIFFRNPKNQELVSMTFREKLGSMDLLGLFLLMPSTVCLLLALQWGGTTFAWGNARIIVLLILSAALFAAFMFVQAYKKTNVTLPIRVLKQRSIGLSIAYAFCMGGSIFLVEYYLPLWFQSIQNKSPGDSGVMLLPLLMGLVLAGVTTGLVVTALGYYTPFMIAGSIFISVAAGLMTTFKATTGRSSWIGYQVLFGFGVGMGFQQSFLAVQTVLPQKDIPIGTTAVIFANNLGGAVFVSVANNLFTNELTKGLRERVPAVDPVTILAAGATEWRSKVGAALTSHSNLDAGVEEMQMSAPSQPLGGSDITIYNPGVDCKARRSIPGTTMACKALFYIY